MHLHKLLVFKNGKLLREIEFKKGLNLILNSASSSAASGNSVGKSTPSRLLDYIFLSSGEDIYTEPEFGKKIPDVVDFISNNQILVELNFKGFDKNDYKVGRVLTTTPKDSEYFIDGKSVEKSKYSDLVGAQIFGQTFDKPSIRNLSHKFIRNTNDKMQKTTKFLHGNTKPDVYDQLYLFLFGFKGLDLLKEKATLTNKISTKTKHLAAYRNPHRESALLKMIKPLKDEESSIKINIKNYDFRESQENSVTGLVKIQGDISDLTIEYSRAKNRVDYLNKSISNLKSQTSNVDGRELSVIYAEAGVAISGDLKRSFEDLMVFHNKVVSNKVNLIERDVHESLTVVEDLRGKMDKLHEAETQIFRSIKEPDTLKSIALAYNDLSKVKEQIASVTALLSKIEDAKDIIISLGKSKDKVVSEITNNIKSLANNIEDFNNYFGELSKYFYGERYIFDLEFDSDKEKCIFEIACITPNPTGGKKKGELSAFDLAYIEFVRSSKLKRPTFVVHDSIEDVDVNQVFDIFTKANQIDGQYIVALLSDKISDAKFLPLKEGSVILELSENDKFFKM
jgi:uncharacterized protein YydD (DUF2326 family)